MNTQSKISLLFGFLLFSFSANSQLITNTGISPTALVEDILVGDGVEVSGVTFTGATEAIGSFNGAATNIGLASGIILTTGTVNNEIGGIGGEQRGPFGPNDTGSSGKANGEPGYAWLQNMKKYGLLIKLRWPAFGQQKRLIYQKI